MRKMLDDKKISNIVLQFGFSIKKTKNVGYKIVLNSQFLLNDVCTSYRGSRVHDLRRKLIFHFLSTNRKKKTPTFLIRLCAFSTAQRVTFSTFFFLFAIFYLRKGWSNWQKCEPTENRLFTVIRNTSLRRTRKRKIWMTNCMKCIWRKMRLILCNFWTRCYFLCRYVND